VHWRCLPAFLHRKFHIPPEIPGRSAKHACDSCSGTPDGTGRAWNAKRRLTQRQIKTQTHLDEGIAERPDIPCPVVEESDLPTHRRELGVAQTRKPSKSAHTVSMLAVRRIIGAKRAQGRVPVVQFKRQVRGSMWPRKETRLTLTMVRPRLGSARLLCSVPTRTFLCG
jgi:hypothetical protein